MRVKFLPLSEGVVCNDTRTKYTVNGVEGIAIEAAGLRETSSHVASWAGLSKLYHGYWKGLRIYLPEELVNKMTEIEIETSFDTLKIALREVHGDNWWIDEAEQKIYIHYPLITITNTTGLEHTIKDLVVRFGYETDGGWIKWTKGLGGKRFTISDVELAANYVHSHLPTADIFSFQSFCVGSGTVMETYTKGRVGTVDYGIHEWGAFLLQLEKYVSWESLEGNPHISISAMTRSNRGSQVPLMDFSSNTTVKLDLLATKMLQTMAAMENPPIEVIKNVSGCRYRIKMTGPPMEEYCRIMLDMVNNDTTLQPLGKLLFDKSKLMYMVDAHGQSLTSKQILFASASIVNLTTGVRIQAAVERSEDGDIVEVLNPQIILSVTNQIENLLNEGAIYALLEDEQTNNKNLTEPTSSDSEATLSLLS